MGFLESKRILPGERLTVVEKLPFNQTLDVEAKGQKVTLGFAVAQYIYTEK
jgi:Fe2+ transport system protein FeoA